MKSPLFRADRTLEDAVVEVIDHHRLERTPSPLCPITAETVGSCATLVTERIVQKAPEMLDQQVAQLLYGMYYYYTSITLTNTQYLNASDINQCREYAC